MLSTQEIKVILENNNYSNNKMFKKTTTKIYNKTKN